MPDDEDSQNFGPAGEGVGVGFLFRNYNKSVTDINTMHSSINWGTLQNPVPLTDPNCLFNIIPQQGGFNTGSQHTSTDLLFLRRRNTDMEPDLFYFNFNGHVGKFVFSQGTDPVTNCGTVAPDQHQILQIPQTDLKISYLLNSGYLQARNEPYENTDWLRSFTIVDEEGNQYLFDQPESTWLHSTIQSASNFGDTAGLSETSYSDVTFNSSWYLSTITTVSGKIIHFNYTTENTGNTLPSTVETSGFNGVPQTGAPTSTTSYNYITGLRLSSIVGDDFTVYFDGNLARQDHTGSSALTAVRIFSKDKSGNQSLIKEFDFNYNYLQSPNPPSTGSSDYMRLMLNNVTERSSDGLNYKPAYQFFYNGYNSNDNIPPLPNRLSSQQDFWGFFNNNGSDGTLLTSIIPTIYVYPNYDRQDHLSVLPLLSPDPNDPVFTISGANRNTDPTAILSGTLNKIQYPTGGTVSFQFESNQFNYEGQNYVGGGLRLKQSTTFDGISIANNMVKQYTYMQSASPTVSSGVLFNLPNYAYTENLSANNQNGQITEFDPGTITYYNHNLVIGNVPQYTMSGFDGINVGYSEIAESINMNGKTVTKYNTPGQYGDMSDADHLFEVPTPLIIDQANTHLPPSTCNTQFMDATGLNTDPWGFPFAPSLNYDWNRGTILSKTIFNQNGNPVSEEDYSYTLYTPMNHAPRYVLGLIDREASNYHLWLNLCTTPNEKLTYYDHIAQYPIITSIAKVLSGKTVKIYDSNNTGTFTTNLTNYKYSITCMNPSFIETTTSKGDLIDKYITYPTDYTGITNNMYNSNSIAINSMQQDNIINPVIEEYTLRKNTDGSNPRVTDAVLNTYKIVNRLPDVIYRSEFKGGNTNFTPVVINDGQTMDSSYQPYLSFDSYDGNGNLLQEHRVSGSTNVCIWDYNNQYPIAKITNAGQSDVAYTSFEADGTGGWTYDTTSGFEINYPSPTGSKCYEFTSGTISDANLNAAKTYIISYWVKQATSAVSITNTSGALSSNIITQGSTINGWTFYTHKIAGTSNVQLNANLGLIDELRLYPVDALMSTYTYIPGIGMTSSTDPKGQSSYYEYDNFQRLINIKDQNGNVIKHLTYHYQGQ